MTEEYQNYINETIHPWLQEHVKDGTIESEDGLKLHYYKAINPNEKASILMVHGFCEFFGKYHETAYRLYQDGYSIFFLELRGFGLSERERSYEDERVYVRSFEDYVQDIHAFYHQIVVPQSLSGKYFLYAHSMGGTAAALYLEEHPDDFRCAVLSSPMLMVNYGKIPDPVVDALVVYTKVKHSVDDEYAPGQHAYTGKDEFEKSSCLDRDRYEYQMSLRAQDKHYQTWGGTWAWARAAKEGTEKAVRNAEKVKTPVLLCQAGKDTMVRLKGQDLFDEKCDKVTLIVYPDSKHEIFNADDQTRTQYYADLKTYFKAFEN